MYVHLIDSDGGEGEGSMRVSVPGTPATPTTPTTPTSGRKVDNVWRSVFHPGSNSATKTIGAEMFDKPLPNSPTVYDWYVLYMWDPIILSNTCHAYEIRL